MEGLSRSWDLALPPDRFNDWTSDMRQSQLRRLMIARDHDRAAIAAIREAVVLLEAETAQPD